MKLKSQNWMTILFSTQNFQEKCLHSFRRNNDSKVYKLRLL